MIFNFPHQDLTPMESNTRPTPRAVRILRTEVYANLCSVSSNLGGGGHGHLGMVMPPAEYQGISIGGVAYVPPPGAPQVPVFTGTAAVVAGQQENYQRELQDWEQYRELHAQIKAQMIKVIPKSYISVLSHAQLGYANTTLRAIMNHLLMKYGTIKDSDMRTNMKHLTAAWDPDTPIETVFTNGTFCCDFAEEGDDPISDATYTRIHPCGHLQASRCVGKGSRGLGKE
jgi:hypothetical protein